MKNYIICGLFFLVVGCGLNIEYSALSPRIVPVYVKPQIANHSQGDCSANSFQRRYVLGGLGTYDGNGNRLSFDFVLRLNDDNSYDGLIRKFENDTEVLPAQTIAGEYVIDEELATINFSNLGAGVVELQSAGARLRIVLAGGYISAEGIQKQVLFYTFWSRLNLLTGADLCAP